MGRSCGQGYERLHIILSDAVDMCKWSKMIRGNWSNRNSDNE